jgi:hypothetical protein
LFSENKILGLESYYLSLLNMKSVKLGGCEPIAVTVTGTHPFLCAFDQTARTFFGDVQLATLLAEFATDMYLKRFHTLISLLCSLPVFSQFLRKFLEAGRYFYLVAEDGSRHRDDLFPPSNGLRASFGDYRGVYFVPLPWHRRHPSQGTTW